MLTLNTVCDSLIDRRGIIVEECQRPVEVAPGTVVLPSTAEEEDQPVSVTDNNDLTLDASANLTVDSRVSFSLLQYFISNNNVI